MSVSRISIGRDGATLSRIANGAWHLVPDEIIGTRAATTRIRERIDACLEAGITTFDHADVYGKYQFEAEFGRVLKGTPALRSQMEIVTKCGILFECDARPGIQVKHYDYSSTHIARSVERSLENFDTDHIELLLLHRPSPMMNPDEIVATLSKLKEDGKIGAAGVSNFSPHQFEMLRSRAAPSLFVANQVEINLLQLERIFDGTLDHCVTHRMCPMAWSPLANGQLSSGIARAAESHAKLNTIREKLTFLATKHEVTEEQVALSWLLSHPSKMQVIIGTGTRNRIRSAGETEQLPIYPMDLQEWFSLLGAARGVDVP